MKLLVARRSDAILLGVMLFVMAGLWMVPIISALNRSLVFNGTDNYVKILTEPTAGVTIYQTYLNSSIIAAGHAFFVVTVSSLAGFAFSKLWLPGMDWLYYVVVVCLAVPATAVIVPLFHTLKSLGLLDSYWAVILPETALTLPFGVLLMRNYFDSLPNDYMEAAMIDGASIPQVFRFVYLPMARPAVINLGVLCVMWSFQDFLLPLLFITKPELTTASMAVSTFQQYLSFTPDNIGKYNASLVLLAIPALILVIAGQRFIRQGLTSGGIKE